MTAWFFVYFLWGYQPATATVAASQSWWIKPVTKSKLTCVQCSLLISRPRVSWGRQWCWEKWRINSTVTQVLWCVSYREVLGLCMTYTPHAVPTGLEGLSRIHITPAINCLWPSGQAENTHREDEKLFFSLPHSEPWTLKHTLNTFNTAILNFNICTSACRSTFTYIYYNILHNYCTLILLLLDIKISHNHNLIMTYTKMFIVFHCILLYFILLTLHCIFIFTSIEHRSTVHVTNTLRILYKYVTNKNLWILSCPHMHQTATLSASVFTAFLLTVGWNCIYIILKIKWT